MVELKRIRERIQARLEAFGFAVEAGDPLVLVAAERAVCLVCDACGQRSVPEGLWDVVVDLACGEYLLVSKDTLLAGGADADALDLPALRQMQEGDVSVTFATPAEAGQSSREQRLDALIAFLRQDVQGRLAAHRRIVW